MDKDSEKKIAGEKAVDFIENEMVVGLGTGSTVKYLIEKLSEKVKAGLNITAVSTSKATAELAASLGIKVVDLSKVNTIDLTIDGADEFDENLNGIKGGGGALLYEKIIASHSKKNIWITDSGKKVHLLGKFPLPVEVIPFGSDLLFNALRQYGYKPEFRKINGSNFISDGNHFIIDLHLAGIPDPAKLNEELNVIPGIVETGLFINIADLVIMGRDDSYEIFKNKKAD